jgi:type VI secretion system secreted protein Hcp
MFNQIRSKRKRAAAKFMLLAIGLSLSAHANAALNAYLTLEGATQGVIEGSTDIAPHEGKITVHGFSHSNGDGPNWQDCKEGTSSHEPLMIIKDRDKSTPLLYTAYATGETFLDFNLQFYEPSNTGAELQTYAIELINARIVAIDQVMLNNRAPENMQYPVQEKVFFVYDAIARVFTDGGIASMDEWQTACGK